jgi:hypothetical protein
LKFSDYHLQEVERTVQRLVRTQSGAAKILRPFVMAILLKSTSVTIVQLSQTAPDATTVAFQAGTRRTGDDNLHAVRRGPYEAMSGTDVTTARRIKCQNREPRRQDLSNPIDSCGRCRTQALSAPSRTSKGSATDARLSHDARVSQSGRHRSRHCYRGRWVTLTAEQQLHHAPFIRRRSRERLKTTTSGTMAIGCDVRRALFRDAHWLLTTLLADSGVRGVLVEIRGVDRRRRIGLNMRNFGGRRGLNGGAMSSKGNDGIGGGS